MIELLRNDIDPFIRAVVRENAEISHFGFLGRGWLEEFKSCSPLERLGMMRNRDLDFELVNRILDVDDTELALEPDEKFQLARACLVNTHVVQNSRRSRTTDFADGFGWFQAGKNAKTIWELVAKWPEDSGVQFFAFKFVQTSDEVKSQIYQKCQAAYLRQTILESCLPDDQQTIRLGRYDADATARYIAYGRSSFMEKTEIEKILRQEKEKWVLDNLFTNPWLGQTVRELQGRLGDR